MVMKKIILASGSPRRHELLELLQIPHEVIPCKNDEEKKLHKELLEQPANNRGTFQQELLEVSFEKVQCVLKSLPREKQQGAIIIGADTVVVCDGKTIGKPRTKEEAIQMLQQILGKEHLVFTGLSVLDVDSNRLLTAIEKTVVRMVNLPEEKIRAYVEAEHILDKAGAYAIQGIGSALIPHIEGCYYNVMGLPVSRLVKMLEELGYDFLAHAKKS
ncbi:MAG: septum formation protein Maf [Candidatus Gerdarchaeota archaeon]|nr:MAG: septum formation protein Maf [Candidatus Gerdarchaeota archaeon]RLI67805.1 MAG: septum formation protein Maf [Candidatus Gerdarchaeota archaeon]